VLSRMSAICWCCAYKVETSLACAFCCCPYECLGGLGVWRSPTLGNWEDGQRLSPFLKKQLEGLITSQKNYSTFVFFAILFSFFLVKFTKHHHDQKISLSQTCFWMFQVELPCEVCKANWPGIIRTRVCLQKTWSGMLGG